MPSRSAAFAVAGIVALACSATAASGLAAGAKKRAFTQHFVGAQIAGSGTKSTQAYKVTDSLNGPAAAVQVTTVTSTSLPVSGKDTATVYYGNGIVKTKDTFT